MLIVYVKREDVDHDDTEGWLVGGYLIKDIIMAQMFEKSDEVYRWFENYCKRISYVQFDIYEIAFDGWTVGEHDFKIEVEANGAAKVLNLPVVRCRRLQESFTRLLKQYNPPKLSLVASRLGLHSDTCPSYCNHDSGEHFNRR